MRDSVFIVADLTGRAYWSNITSSSSSRHSITEEQFVAYVEYLIDNIRVYRQCVGIPMGTDCAPLLANLFLFSYEYSYMRDLIKTDLELAKKINNTMRYIDDLLTLNNATFHLVIADIPQRAPTEEDYGMRNPTVVLRYTNNYRKWEIFFIWLPWNARSCPYVCLYSAKKLFNT